MYENTVTYVNITMGNIPLTVAQDASQFNSPTQLSIQNLPSGEQFPTNSNQPIGFIVPGSIPCFTQQISPYGPPSLTSPYPQQSITPVMSATTPYVQPLNPQTQEYSQSQLPYPDMNVQQPAQNPYPNFNAEVTPTAPSFQ